MKHAISFKQYRAMDAGIFTALLCICESLIVLAATRWFPAQPYALSLTPAIVAIVMIRWGAFAAFPAAAGAMVYCLLSGPRRSIISFISLAIWQPWRFCLLSAALHGKRSMTMCFCA